MFVTDGSTDAHKKKSVSADTTLIFDHSDHLLSELVQPAQYSKPQMKMLIMVSAIKLQNFTEFFRIWIESFVNCVAD